MGNQTSATTGLKNYKDVDQKLTQLEQKIQDLINQYSLEITYDEMMQLLSIYYKHQKLDDKLINSLENKIKTLPKDKNNFIIHFIADSNNKAPLHLIIETAQLIYNTQIDEIYIIMMFGEVKSLNFAQIDQLSQAYKTGEF